MSVIVFEQAIFKSTAYLTIKSLASLKVLIEFYRRRQFHRAQNRRNKHSKPVFVNNGQITFLYKEAGRMDISQATFSRAITELVSLGFIDVAEYSSGLHRQPTKYAISERWQKYGTPEFQFVERKVIKPPFIRARKNIAIMNGDQNRKTVITGGGNDE